MLICIIHSFRLRMLILVSIKHWDTACMESWTQRTFMWMLWMVISSQKEGSLLSTSANLVFPSWLQTQMDMENQRLLISMYAMQLCDSASSRRFSMHENIFPLFRCLCCMKTRRLFWLLTFLPLCLLSMKMPLWSKIFQLFFQWVSSEVSETTQYFVPSCVIQGCRHYIGLESTHHQNWSSYWSYEESSLTGPHYVRCSFSQTVGL